MAAATCRRGQRKRTTGADIDTGQQIGDYEVVGKLGAGGLGAVYEVRHLISGRSEAMKVLLADREVTTPEMAERFRREVQLLAALNHPNIAALHNAFYHDGQLMMVMELIRGETLRGRSMRTALPLAKILEYVSHVLDALGYAHARQVVHRDIKPSNVMITDEDVVKLLDFGIAITGQSSDLTNAGFILGSLSYMSPEQVSGAKATAKSDIYSVGVTLYELITGRLPITGTTNYEILTGHLHAIPIAPIALNPALPLAISNAVLRSLEKDPERRFASAREFSEALLPSARSLGNADSDARRLAHQDATTMPPAPGAIKPSTGGTPVGGVASGVPLGSVSGPASGSSAGGAASLPLEELTRQLAIHIGPVAKFVVKKLATQFTDLDRMYAEAAKQIESEAGRRQFLSSKRG